MGTVEQRHRVFSPSYSLTSEKEWDSSYRSNFAWWGTHGYDTTSHTGMGSSMAKTWGLLWNGTISSAVTSVGLGSSLPWSVTPHTGHKESDKLLWVKLHNTSQILWKISTELSMTLGKGWSESPRCEMHVPGVPVDGCHHESCPAKLVPCVHICTCFQQPGKRRDMVRK